MIEYREKNVNPKNKKTGDCSTRALVGVLNIPYKEAIQLQAEAAIKTCYGITNKQVMEYVLKQFGYIKMKQPRKQDGTKYKVREMDELLTKRQMQEGVLITIANHHTCITGRVIQDIWDCGGKSVGNYYIKVR